MLETFETQKDYCDSDKSAHPDRNATQGEAIELVLGTSESQLPGRAHQKLTLCHGGLGMSRDV